jgi:hypothetical protein
MPSTITVIAIAITPSLNCSVRATAKWFSR